MTSLHAVTGAHTTESVLLHNTGETATLNGPDHIHPLDFIEQLDRQLLTDSMIDRFAISAKLANITLRLAIGLLQQLNTSTRTSLGSPIECST